MPACPICAVTGLDTRQTNSAANKVVSMVENRILLSLDEVIDGVGTPIPASRISNRRVVRFRLHVIASSVDEHAHYRKHRASAWAGPTNGRVMTVDPLMPDDSQTFAIPGSRDRLRNQRTFPDRLGRLRFARCHGRLLPAQCLRRQLAEQLTVVGGKSAEVPLSVVSEYVTDSRAIGL